MPNSWTSSRPDPAAAEALQREDAPKGTRIGSQPSSTMDATYRPKLRAHARACLDRLARGVRVGRPPRANVRVHDGGGAGVHPGLRWHTRELTPLPSPPLPFTPD